MRHPEPARGTRAGAPARPRRAERRARRELPAGDARAVEPRAGTPLGDEPGAGDRARLGLRPDRPLRPAGGLRLRLGGDGRDPVHQRLPRRGPAAHPHLARRLPRRDVRRPGDPRRALPAGRARRRAGPGRRRLADGGVLRTPREHGARVRPARHRPRAGRHGAEGGRTLEHLQVQRRKVDGDRRQRRQGLRPAVRGDGPAGAGRRIRSSRPTRPAARTRRSSKGSSPSGPDATRRRRSTPSSTRRA